MSKRKYFPSERINSVAEFESCDSMWFIVCYGSDKKTTHRAFLISWQYRTLKQFIDNRSLYVARLRDEGSTN